MDENLIEVSNDQCGCEGANTGTGGAALRDTGAAPGAGGAAGATLEVLRDVQRAYEERMEMLERVPSHKRLQLQTELLRSWVSDLVGQNALLARAVEDLEAEAITRLFLERRRHAEVLCETRAELCSTRRRLARAHADRRGLLEVLRRLRDLDYCRLDGIHFYEVTEEDIFGTVDWSHNKMEQGDAQHKQNSDLKKIHRHRLL